MNNIQGFIRYQRKKLGLTQAELASKAGVGIRFIRELEQGKMTLQLDKVAQVLDLFGFQLAAAKQAVDAYDVFWNYFNKAVKITMADKSIKYGILMKEVIDRGTGKIESWKFVPNNNAITYLREPGDELMESISHKEISSIELQ